MGNQLLAKDLYLDQLKDITFSNIEEYFNERIAECIYLDYKTTVEDSKGIAKDVAAMANAEGGIILIGIRTDEKPGKPGIPVEIVGVTDPEGIISQISKRCANAIKPRLVPDMFHYSIPDNPDKFIVLLRIPESVEAPHWLGTADSCTIPIRVNDFTVHTDGIKLLMPNDLASYANQKAELLERSRKLLERASVRAGELPQRGTYLSIGVVPQYPKQRLCELTQLLDHLTTVKSEFLRGSPITGTANESVFLRCDRPGWNYLEITAWGSIFECCEISTVSNSGEESIQFYDVIKKTIRALNRVHRLFRAMSFSGRLYIEVSLRFSRLQIPFTAQTDRHAWPTLGTPLDLEADFNLTCYTDDILKPKVTKKLISEQLFCCGLGQISDDVYLEEMLKSLGVKF